eukprot:6622288-Pyramimonas_sp.AAC.1
MALGKRPEVDMHGKPWPENHAMTRMLLAYGRDLGFIGATCWVNGDLMDVHKTQGLPAVSATYNP